MPNTHTFTAYERTHTDIHITQNMYRKNCFCIKLKLANACIYKGVLELSLALLFSDLHEYPHTTTTPPKMRYENIFYLRGSSSTSLQVYLLYLITINGCLFQHLHLDLNRSSIKANLPMLAQKHGLYGSPA
jgi:hypothetical protein